MSAGDNWCTDSRELDLVEKICGVREWHLDPATNTHSRVPALVACHGGIALADPPLLPQQPAFPGGRLRMKVDGLSFEWPAAWDVWENPPYSDPAPWVAQALWHACAGGRGVALLPGTLDTFWGQAVLKARRHPEPALRCVFKTASARETAAYRAFEDLVAGYEASGAPGCDLVSYQLPSFPIYVERQGMPHAGKEIVRVHRPHLLGNPWSHKPSELAEIVSSREEAIGRYVEWLDGLPAWSEEGQELIRLADLRCSISLVCFCAPDPCHAEVLAQRIAALRIQRAGPRWQVLMLRRRVSFRDPERPWHGPVPGNRGSSMLVFWGFDPLECDPEIGEWL